jgi:hypothetical protein
MNKKYNLNIPLKLDEKYISHYNKKRKYTYVHTNKIKILKNVFN